MSATKKPSKSAAKRKASSGIAERVRLGENAYAVKQTVDKKTWRGIVKEAHNKGFTVNSALTDVPDELKARTKSSLRTEAESRVAEAFKPAQDELDYRGRQATNLRATRLADQEKYKQWADQQVSLQNAAATRADQAYQGFLANQSQQAQQRAATLGAQATAQSSGGISGDVSNSVQVKGMNERLAADAKQAENAQAANLAGQAMDSERGAAITASLQGMHANIRANAETDYSKSNADLTKAGLELKSDRALKVIDTYTGLLSKEADKANANREFDGLMQQIDQKAASDKLDYQKFLIGNQTTVRGQNKAANTSRENNKRTVEATKRGQTLNAQERQADRVQRASDKRLDRQSRESVAAQKIAATGERDAAKTKLANQKTTAVIDTIASILRQQQKGKNGKKGSGYLWDAEQLKWLPSRQVLISRGATDAQINAGLAHARGRLLTPQEKAAVGILE